MSSRPRSNGTVPRGRELRRRQLRAVPGRERRPAPARDRGRRWPCGPRRGGASRWASRRLRCQQPFSGHRRQGPEPDARLSVRCRRRGALTANHPASAALPPKSGPRHFAFHPNGRWVFTINEQAATITTFAWDAKSGSLTASAACRRDRRGHDRLDGGDRRAPQRPVRVWLEPRARQHRGVQRRRRRRADAWSSTSRRAARRRAISPSIPPAAG